VKLIKAILTFGSLSLFLFATQSNLSSCQKPPPEIIRDTVIIRDTIRIVDSSSCNCYDLKDGLVAWYNFKGGTLKDSSGNNNHIILNNSATLATDRFGKANSAYLFNGSGSYMRVANSASLNPANGITITAILKINGFYAGNCTVSQVFGKGSTEHVNGFYSMRVFSTVGCGNPVDVTKELFGGVYGNANNNASIGSVDYLQTNKWYSVVYTYGNNESKIYVDGVLKKTVAESPNIAFTANTQDLFIGKEDDATYPFWFTGILDDVRIYNKPLCAAAVTQLYNLKE
jgi:hypothetical protein